jgi:hypothetical protein
MRRARYALSTALLLMSGSALPAFAQSAAEVIERARAEARQFNEYKAALEDPDQSVRLAVFENMLTQQSAPLRMMAIQTGLTNDDLILRSRALLAQIMGMDQLHVQITVNSQATSKAQEATRKFVDEKNGVLVFSISQKDPETGSFRLGHSNIGYSGQITHIQLQANAGTTYSLNLSLQDDSTLKGQFIDQRTGINALASVKFF